MTMTNEEALEKLARGELKVPDVLKIQKENDAAAKDKPITIKRGEKGGVVVSGLGYRFPTTLYTRGWRRLLDPQVVADVLAACDQADAEDAAEAALNAAKAA